PPTCLLPCVLLRAAIIAHCPPLSLIAYLLHPVLRTSYFEPRTSVLASSTAPTMHQPRLRYWPGEQALRRHPPRWAHSPGPARLRRPRPPHGRSLTNGP